MLAAGSSLDGRRRRMSMLWESWRSELEALPALADEWSEGAADEFVRNLHSLAARKSALRKSALELADEIKDIHVYYEDLLAFFGIEPAFLRWSVMNCPGGEVGQARSALAEWREAPSEAQRRLPAPRRETSFLYGHSEIAGRSAERRRGDSALVSSSRRAPGAAERRARGTANSGGGRNRSRPGGIAARHGGSAGGIRDGRYVVRMAIRM
jgi:hypothetical protein